MQTLHQSTELRVVKLLTCIAFGNFGIRMGFDEQAIHAHGGASACEVGDAVGIAHRMARIQNHGKIGVFLQVSHPAKVEVCLLYTSRCV